MFSAVRLHLAFFLLWAWGPLLALGAQPVPSTVTAYFSERPPFTITEGQRGLLINQTKIIFAEAGLKARFIELPPSFVAGLLRVSEGAALGLGWYKLPGNSLRGRFSLPFYQERPMVALLNARAAQQAGPSVRLESLFASPLTLGLKTGASLGPELDQRIRARGIVPMETVVDIPALLRLVAMGRMDYTLLCEEEAQYLLANDPSLSGLVLAKLPDAPPGNYRYFFYPETLDPAIADRIDAAIAKLK